MNEQNNLEILDILTIVSFILQMQNQSKIFGISDVRSELQKAVKEIHAHLEIQDEKLNKILGVLHVEND